MFVVIKIALTYFPLVPHLFQVVENGNVCISGAYVDLKEGSNTSQKTVSFSFYSSAQS